MEFYRSHVLICNGEHCNSELPRIIYKKFADLIETNKLQDEIRLLSTDCLGECENGCMVIVYPEGAIYYIRKESDVERIVLEHLVNGNIVKDLVYQDGGIYNFSSIEKASFFKMQKRVALKNCGIINPENIDEYLARDGYKALEKCLFELGPEKVIDIITKSGLRGRGGGGFSTGLKWKLTRANQSSKKYVICNADEGDPGAFMDRSVLEGDPHSVLEAMIIAGFAIGADEGYIYVRAEYPNAVHKLTIAINQAREYGILGSNVLGTNFKFNIGLRLGSGAFVCGEETALIASIEGKRGEPSQRPPFPAESGLFGKPTLINNVETYANVAQIILNGPQWFSSMGSEKSKGTKVFALGGKIANTGLVEIPMGMPLREIIYDIGGGIPNGKKFKAAQTGGPSGGCIPASHIDIPIDYENLTAIGSMVGSGGMIVMDEDTCMVDIAKFFLEFTADESCGKCTPCRIGTKKMLDILTRITNGKGEEGDVEKLQALAENITKTALCGLGQTAPNPVLSTIHFFRSEYDAHIREKRCPAGYCRNLLHYVIDEDKCRGCGLCAKHCPVNAISGERKKPYVIDFDKCIKCGVCIETCPFKAINKQ